MKIKQILNIVLIAAVVAIGMVATVFISPSAFADPAVDKVKCKDGKTVEATPTMKDPKDILDDKDYQYACRNHDGYKPVDETINCKDGTNQNVYRSAADPKDKLTNADRKAACKEHGGIKVEETPPADGGDGGLSNPIEGSDCGGVQTAIIKCDEKYDNKGDIETNGVWALLMLVLNILTAGVGIVAVGGIVYGAILYTTAEDKADQVKKATDIITNVVIGLIAFALMWALLNFIVPGGVFK